MTVEEIIAQKLREREKENLAALNQDVDRAREYALGRFPKYVDEDETPTGFFNTMEYFTVDFPDVDRLVIYPVKFGEPMPGCRVEHRLTWEDGWLYWVGDFVIRRELLGTKGEIKLLIGRAEGRPMGESNGE